MTAKLPSSSVLHAVSTITKPRHHASIQPVILFAAAGPQRRQYAKQRQSPPPPTRNPIENPLPQYSVRSALDLISKNRPSDPINPPRSTLPPPLELPTRGPANAAVYLFRLGRAYGGFYKDGIKSVWFNCQAARLLRERITKQFGARDVADAVAKEMITRSDFQLLARNAHDIGKMPLFGLLVLLFGEWLPLVVPFIPSAVPMTSRIPKQIRDMRLKAEERRRISYRQGITEPNTTQIPNPKDFEAGDEKSRLLSLGWPLAFNLTFCVALLKPLRIDQLHHISTTLNLHSSLWDRVQLTPPVPLLRRAIARRIQHLAFDDLLLIRAGGAARLSPAELHLACEARGLDVLGIPDEVLRHSLAWWLMRQEEDKGKGEALLPMLFRRLAIRDWVTLNLSAKS